MDLDRANAVIIEHREYLLSHRYKKGDHEYYAIVKEYSFALARRDEIAGAPSLPGDHNFALLPDELLDIIFRFLPREGTVLDKVCWRWRNMWHGLTSLNTLRGNNR